MIRHMNKTIFPTNQLQHTNVTRKLIFLIIEHRYVQIFIVIEHEEIFRSVRISVILLVTIYRTERTSHVCHLIDVLVQHHGLRHFTRPFRPTLPRTVVQAEVVRHEHHARHSPVGIAGAVLANSIVQLVLVPHQHQMVGVVILEKTVGPPSA